jgi:hypothetical protein
VLGDLPAARMQSAAVAATVVAVILLAVAVLRYSFGRRGSRPAGFALGLAIVASVAVPLWIRGPGELPVPQVPRATAGPAGTSAILASVAPRVRLLLLDGASLGVIRDRIAGGRLPNLGYLLDRGAVLPLATLKPTQAEPVWTAAATGKYPAKNGIRTNAVFRTSLADTEVADLLPDYCFAYALVYQQYLEAQSLSREDIRARPFWDVAADYDLGSGIVRWPLTQPASLSRGYLISDQFHLGLRSPLRLAEAEAGVPTSAVDIAGRVFDERAFPDPPPPGVSAPAELSAGDADRASWDAAYLEVARQLEPRFAPHVTAVRLSAIDTVSHAYWGAADPAVAPDRRTGDAALIDAAYAAVDAALGWEREQLRPGDLLLVVSAFGMEPVSGPKRLLAWLLQQPDLSGSHESAPDGFLIAYGRDVVHAELPRGAVVDLAPTVLFYLGIPVGRDMDGYARTDLFTRAWRRDHPVTFISTHER